MLSANRTTITCRLVSLHAYVLNLQQYVQMWCSGYADKLVLIGMRSGGVKAWHLDTRRMVASLQPEGSPAAVLALASSPTDSSFACATSAAASGKIAHYFHNISQTLHDFSHLLWQKIQVDVFIPNTLSVPSVRCEVVSILFGSCHEVLPRMNAIELELACGIEA